MTTDPSLLDELPDGLEPVLPSFEVLARFPQAADDGEAACQAVQRQLADLRGMWQDVVIERREPDGRWMVVVRFVVVSTDPHTAVVGVHDSVRETGLLPDEVWAGHQYA